MQQPPPYQDKFTGTIREVLEHIAMYISTSFYLAEMTELYVMIQAEPMANHEVTKGRVTASYRAVKRCCRTEYIMEIVDSTTIG